MKYNLNLLILLVLATKLILLFIVNKELKMNPDEESNYQIALNNQNGNGYTLFDSEEESFIPTAFHGTFPVFTYEFLIKHNIKKEIWICFVYGLSLILFCLSINYFHKLCLLVIENEKYALFSTITYCFYPSILFYIGPLFLYENIVLPLLVIIIFRLLIALNNGFMKADYFVIPIAIAFSCLYRSQMLAVYLVILTPYALFILTRRSHKLILLLLLSISFTFLLHIPILIKNKEMFGAYILSTQSGFEFLQGHNPTAKGSWMGDWKNSTSELYKYANSQIKNISDLNELEESKARQQVGIKWIKENPMGEFKLVLRKIAIYFLPKNYDVLQGANVLNPINFLIHSFFIGYILMQVYKRAISENELIIFSPIAASLMLSIIFFVGYRWRYYAEPFMIIFAWKFILVLKTRYDTKKLSGIKFI